MEYLVTMTTRVPEGTAGEAVDAVRAREAAHSRELAAQGHLLRLWRPPLRPGEWRTFGLFADDVYSMRFAWLSHGQVPPTGLKPHDDLLAAFPYLGLPNP